MARLTDEEYDAAFQSPMQRLAQDVAPGFDFWPYVDAMPEAEFEGFDCSEGNVEYVYRDSSGQFEHVLITSDRPDVFMIILLDRIAETVVGHRLLNLPALYGIEPGPSRPARPSPKRAIQTTAALLAAIACRPEAPGMNPEQLKDFATRYTAAWCSQNPASVAAFFADSGSLTINAGPASVGRVAITAAAQGFMTAFPDMVVTMDTATMKGEKATYRWTLTGTNTGPGGTGRAVRIQGYEEWTLGSDGLIAESKGHFDQAEYQRQLAEGAPPTR